MLGQVNGLILQPMAHTKTNHLIGSLQSVGQNQYSVFQSQFQYKILMNQYSWRLSCEKKRPGALETVTCL